MGIFWYIGYWLMVGTIPYPSTTSTTSPPYPLILTPYPFNYHNIIRMSPFPISLCIKINASSTSTLPPTPKLSYLLIFLTSQLPLHTPGGFAARYYSSSPLTALTIFIYPFCFIFLLWTFWLIWYC